MSERFSLKSWTRDGGSVYGAPHELWNEVLITFPPGYWGEVMSPPGWVDIDSFAVTPGDMSIEHIMARARQVTDRSGIAADDDPSRQPISADVPTCKGCDQPAKDMSQGRVQDRFDPTGAIGGAYLCADCWEAIDNADEVTGAYGAACIPLRRVGDMPA